MTDSFALTCEWCGRPLPRRGSRPGRRARYCRASCRQRAYEARLVANAAGRLVPAVQEKAAWDDAELGELAARLEDLARAQEEARSAVGDDEPDYAVAFEQLFAAVARLNPRRGADVIRTRAEPWVS